MNILLLLCHGVSLYMNVCYFLEIPVCNKATLIPQASLEEKLKLLEADKDSWTQMEVAKAPFYFWWY